MKKVFFFVLSFILLSNVIVSIVSNVSELDLNENWISTKNTKWSPNGEKIGSILNNNLFIINKKGEIEYKSKRDYGHGLNIEWINNNKVAISYGYPYILEIIDLESGEKEKFNLPHSAFSLSYNKKRNEIAITYENLVRLLDLESNRISTLIEIRGTTINMAFYNKDGNKLFFVVSGMQTFPFLYVFDFEGWAFDRVSEEFLTPNYIDELGNKGYFIKGEGTLFGYEPEIVEIDLETLEIKEYEKEESDIVVNGYKIDPNLKFKRYSSDERKGMYLVLSPDIDSAFVVDSEGVRMINDLSSYQE